VEDFMRTQFSKKKISILISMFGLLSSSAMAHAGYVVIDDDLMPTPGISQGWAAPQTAQGSLQHYQIQFTKDRSPLTAAARAVLDAIIPQIRGQSIRIVGRPDAQYVAAGKLALLASNRANVLKNYLLQMGIPANNISMDVDNSPNPQANGITYPSDIFVGSNQVKAPEDEDAQLYISNSQKSYGATRAGNTGYSPASDIAQPAITRQPIVQQQSQPQPVPKTQSLNLTSNEKAARAQIIQFILNATQSGQMDAQSAFKMMRIISGTDGQQSAQSASPTPVDRQPYQASADKSRLMLVNTAKPTDNNKPLFVTAAPKSADWKVDSTKTLRENITAWSLSADWGIPEWLATQDFNVTRTTYLTGGFPDVLKQISDTSGLNICITKNPKTIRITDHNVSCKE
jgi:hypothetical protein